MFPHKNGVNSGRNQKQNRHDEGQVPQCLRANGREACSEERLALFMYTFISLMYIHISTNIDKCRFVSLIAIRVSCQRVTQRWLESFITEMKGRKQKKNKSTSFRAAVPFAVSRASKAPWFRQQSRATASTAKAKVCSYLFIFNVKSKGIRYYPHKAG